MIRFHISAQKRKGNAPKRLNVSTLKDPSKVEQLRESISKNLVRDSASDEPLEHRWKSLRDIVYSSAADTIGYQKRNHRDWFDENNPVIMDLLRQKQFAFQDFLGRNTQENQERYRLARNIYQREIRRIQNQWWLDHAKEMEQHAERRDSRSFFQSVKFIYQRRQSGMSPINDEDGKRLSDKGAILARWKRHFSALLNQPGTVDHSVLDDIPQEELLTELETPPTLEEIALSHLADNKAPGPDCIPAEVLKAGGPALFSELHYLLLLIWKEERVPKDMKNGPIVAIFKKQCRFSCGNYRGITLVSVIGKLFARIILNRVRPCIEKHLPETQCSFRSGRLTNDMMFAVPQQWRSAENNNTSNT